MLHTIRLLYISGYLYMFCVNINLLSAQTSSRSLVIFFLQASSSSSHFTAFNIINIHIKIVSYWAKHAHFIKFKFIECAYSDLQF